MKAAMDAIELSWMEKLLFWDEDSLFHAFSTFSRDSHTIKKILNIEYNLHKNEK